MVFSAEWALISLDKEHLIDVKYVTFTLFTHSSENSLMAETSCGKLVYIYTYDRYDSQIVHQNLTL